MAVLWLFSDYLSRVYGGWLLPLVGFFLAPTTTLAYAVVENESLTMRGWGGALMVIAILSTSARWAGVGERSSASDLDARRFEFPEIYVRLFSQ